MKIYTSYFANIRSLATEGITPISIARYSPRWFNGARFTSLAPTGYMLSEACSRENYLKGYESILNNLNAADVVREIEAISKGRDVALCCYEKPGDFCHRHLLSEWLRKNGYNVDEWKKDASKAQPQQPSLFTGS